MFTFGREHEKKHAVANVRKSEQAELITNVIDSIHDLLEGTASEDDLVKAIKEAFTEGGSGVWEGAGTWLRKATAHYPLLGNVWRDLATHPRAEVRFRVACFLADMPPDVYVELSAVLASDGAKRVSTMAKARIEEVGSRTVI